jgi:predicted homoserine dehydrogenase-like protein
MACIAEAYLDGWAILQPTFGFVTNVYSYAKKDLRKGDELDGIGGYAAYGLIENVVDNKSHPGLPICLAEEVTLKRDLKKDEKIFMEDIDINANSAKFEIYQSELES